jgi:hypothetical protein
MEIFFHNVLTSSSIDIANHVVIRSSSSNGGGSYGTTVHT